eukprot:gb/GFBE01002347.1/.p1 GENE.gb/GFBE01002347.1/~~gb/GFBE01002347.1/.p1  ORF type:complete len:524 (+),score=61.41 gb/GFBE01002347.1/:1-1572(+)
MENARRRVESKRTRSCGRAIKEEVAAIVSLVAASWHQHGKIVPLAVAQMLLLADQPLLPANMSRVAAEFGFDGAERDEMLGGIVAVVFFSTGAISSLLAGRLADIMSRSWLVSCFVLIGGVGSFMNSRISGFTGLLFCRAAAGTALGGLLPPSFAIVGDIYAADERPHAIAMLAIIAGFGPALGQGLAGFLGPEAGWRAPFMVVGSAAFCFSLFLFAFLKEPVKDMKDKLAIEHEPSAYCKSLCSALTKPTVFLICMQGVAGCVPWAVIQTFLTDYLAEDAHLGVQGATGVLFTFGCGCLAGTAGGGQLGQQLYRKDKRLQVLLMALTVWGGLLPMLALFSSAGTWGHLWLFHILAFCGALLASVAGCNAKAVLLNTVPGNSRGAIFGVYSIMDDLGKGLGPALVSSWVRHLGRRTSFMIGLGFWVPCGLICLAMVWTVPADDISASESVGVAANSGNSLHLPELSPGAAATPSCDPDLSPICSPLEKRSPSGAGGATPRLCRASSQRIGRSSFGTVSSPKSP